MGRDTPYPQTWLNQHQAWLTDADDEGDEGDEGDEWEDTEYDEEDDAPTGRAGSRVLYSEGWL